MKGTPFIITSNLPPAELFGPIASNNLGARAMICNIADIELFPLINEIIQTHNLEPYIENNLLIPHDLI